VQLQTPLVVFCVKLDVKHVVQPVELVHEEQLAAQGLQVPLCRNVEFGQVRQLVALVQVKHPEAQA
jgi:hypothetical protein